MGVLIVWFSVGFMVGKHQNIDDSLILLESGEIQFIELDLSVEFAELAEVESTIEFDWNWREGYEMIGGIDNWELDDFLGYYQKTENPLIYLNTKGGDADIGFAIYDIIKTGGKETTVVAIGEVYSAGIMIFLAADKRYATQNTTFMAHPVSCNGCNIGMKGILLPIRQTQMKQIYKDEGFDHIFEEEIYYTVDQIYEMGLLDGII